MKNKNKNLIGILVILILLIGVIKVNFYKSTSRVKVSTHESSNESESKTYSENINVENYSFKSTTKKIINKDTIINEIKAQIKLKSKGNTNFDFNKIISHYMSANYNSEVNYTWTADVWKNGQFHKLANENYIEVKGEKKFTGMFTEKEAKASIQKDVLKEVKKQVQKEIEKQAKEIQ